MRKVSFAVLLVVLLGAIVSCASTPVEEQYPERWEKTHIGMTLEEFKQVWPEAKYGGTGDIEGKTEVWTFIEGRYKVEVEYFTFQDNKLIKFAGMNY